MTEAKSETVLVASTNRLLKVAQRIVGLVAIVAIFGVLFRNKNLVSELVQSAHWARVALSGLILSVLHLFVVTGFHSIHHALGVGRPFREDLMRYLLRLPARYVPGGIWHTAARYADIQLKHKLGRRILSILFAAEMGMVAATGLFVAGLSIVSSISNDTHAVLIGLVMIAAGLTIFLILCATTRWRAIPVRVRGVLASSLALGLNWIGLGLAFAVFAQSLSGSVFGSCPIDAVAATYEFSATLGFVAVFAPQGWGVTEVAFGYFNTCHATLALGIAAVTGFRLVMLVTDGVVYAVTLLAAWLSGTRLRQS